MTDGGPPGRTDRVQLPGRETDVVIGAGVRDTLRAALAERYPRAERCGLVIDARVAELWPPFLPEGASDADAALDVIRVRAPAGEASKTREVLADLQDALLVLKRDEPVVAIGGGAVLDAAGFAAATVRRGLDWIAVPTTVVGMADASVGGKVAVNHPTGKNLLGTFHPPRLVLVDPIWLETLPERDRISGLAEVWKVGRIAAPKLLARLVDGGPRTPAAWTELLSAAIGVKARIVEADERDQGARRALNYGHTVGHALERLLGNERMRHGEAVAIGMGVAARLAAARGLVPGEMPGAQDDALQRLGLPVRMPAEAAADPEAVLAVLARDKKRQAGRGHTFALPEGDLGVVIVDDVTDAEVRAVLTADG